MLGDVIKGQAALNALPPAVAGAVHLHRALDRYTDNHDYILTLRTQFPDSHRRYAGIMLDMALDHLLARDFSDWFETPLSEYAETVYGKLDQVRHHAPPEGARLIGVMSQGDWLGAYAAWSGLAGSLRRMARRGRGHPALLEAPELLAAQWPTIEAGYPDFFRDVRDFSRTPG